MRLILVLSLFFFTVSVSAAEQLFDLKKVADGVYIALARHQHIINSNAGVIILDDGVLIIDTHSKPSAARALIEQIKTITDKPVRYVVDQRVPEAEFEVGQYTGALNESRRPQAIELNDQFLRR